MEQTDNAIRGVLTRARRRSHTKTADIHCCWLIDHARHDLAGNNHPRIGAGLARRVLDVFPDQCPAARHGIHI